MSEARAQAQTTVDADLLPLATGMLFFVPIAFVGNELGVLLRYPQLGAAVLYPPYAALTAALVASQASSATFRIPRSAALVALGDKQESPSVRQVCSRQRCPMPGP